MFFNIFIIMNEKIKRLIIDNVFRGVDVDFNIYMEYEVLKLRVKIDSEKLYKSSGYFDKDYYNLIYGLWDYELDEELHEFLPMVGYDFEEIEYFFDKSDLDGYKNLFYALNDLNYDYNVFDGFYSSPWLYIQFNASGVEVDNLYYVLEDEFDLSVDDVILLSRNS
jgi:hypothetical protein